VQGVLRRVRVHLNATEATGSGPASATNVEARVTLWLSQVHSTRKRLPGDQTEVNRPTKVEGRLLEMRLNRPGRLVDPPAPPALRWVDNIKSARAPREGYDAVGLVERRPTQPYLQSPKTELCFQNSRGCVSPERPILSAI
jgi:hypothetical protein